jgi:hypothetical protein
VACRCMITDTIETDFLMLPVAVLEAYESTEVY